MTERRSAIVVGASGDIGQAVALRLNSLGYRLTLTWNRGEPNRLIDGQWVQVDVRDADAIRQTIARAEAAHGVPFALVYCSGIVRDRPLMLMTDELWTEVMDVNLRGAFHCIRGVSRSMMAAGRGRLVMIGSVTAQRAQAGQAAYSASKAGLEALARVTARELGRYQVTCNVVVPGAIESRMFRNTQEAVVQTAIRNTPLRRLGEPRHVASAVAYLLDDDADFVTGQTLVVDGGMSL